MKLVVFDLDSTLIDAEGIDEIAKLAGKEEEIRKITKKAMEGEIPFNEALKKRVKLLKGLEIEKVEEVANSLPLMKGAKETIEELRKHGIKTGVVSGGFDIVVNKIKNELGLDYAISNKLIVENGKLTGEVVGPIVDEESKGEALEEIAEKVGVDLSEVVAVGDGANDISMFRRAGLAIAFNSKPKVSSAADVVVLEKDLREILPHILKTKTVEDLKKERKEVEIRIKQLKKNISEKRALLRKINRKKREIIDTIRIKNSEANRERALRDKVNRKIKELKAKRKVENMRIKELKEELKKLQSSSGKGDFRKIRREIQALEWKLQTTVLDIKKEDAMVKRIETLREKLKNYEELIQISDRIEKHKNASKKIHNQIIKLSRESQRHHEKFLRALRKIKEKEKEIDELNKQKQEIIPVLEKERKDLAFYLKLIKKIDNKIKKAESEIEEITYRSGERELREKAEKIYKRFKKGEKLSLEDIYLLRRFNLV